MNIALHRGRHQSLDRLVMGNALADVRGAQGHQRHVKGLDRQREGCFGGRLGDIGVAPGPYFRITSPNYTGTLGADWVLGTNGNDIINGLGGDDRIKGGGGNDILVGGAGSDLLNGGDGSDLYLLTDFSDYSSGETIKDDGSTGTDELRLAATAAGTLELNAWVEGIESIVIGTGTAASAVTKSTTAININASALISDVSLTGNAGANLTFTARVRPANATLVSKAFLGLPNVASIAAVSLSPNAAAISCSSPPGGAAPNSPAIARSSSANACAICSSSVTGYPSRARSSLLE